MHILGGGAPNETVVSPRGAPALQAHFQVPQDPPRREESLLLRPRRTQRSPWTAARLADASSKLQRVSPAESAPLKGTQAKKKTQITEELCCHLFWTSRGQLASRGFLTLSGRLLEGVCVGGGAFRKLCRRNPQKALNNITKRSRSRQRRKAIKTRSTPGAGDPRPRVGSRPGI